MTTPGIVTTIGLDVLDRGTADSDPDQTFRYGNIIELTHVGSTPGSNDNLSLKGSTLSINDNGTASEYTDDDIDYTTGTSYLEKDSFLLCPDG